MSLDALYTLIVIAGVILLFVTEVLTVDLVALLGMIALVLLGVITPEQGVEGFSNKATMTVAFMFILSTALLNTGALQVLAFRLSSVFRENFKLGMLLMMLLIAAMSAFVNNTPVVAVFIPAIISIANASGQPASKMLIPLSFASIFGGTCTLIGTSTNILVSGIAERDGAAPIGMFDSLPMGLIFVTAGVLYLFFIGIRLLPNRKTTSTIKSKFSLRDYLAEIVLLPDALSIGKTIEDSPLVKELGMDIIQVKRGDERFHHPDKSFVLKAQDILKVRCDVSKIRQLKDRVRVSDTAPIEIGDNNFKGANSVLVELVISANSSFVGKNLRDINFIKRFRSIPLAIRTSDEVINEDIKEVELRSGDTILVEVGSDDLEELKRIEGQKDSPYYLLSEDVITDFNKRKFFTVISVSMTAFLLATFGVLDIMVATLTGVAVLVILRCIDMKQAYEAINWKVIFLLAGALSLGTAMENTGLDILIAELLTGTLGKWGPVALVSGLYLATTLLTEIMSNNGTAALLTPIAVTTAQKMGVDPMPFVMAIMFAASASFMTPVGYHTNTMVYSVGQYKFRDFFKVGWGLSLLFWILATVFIPLIYSF